MSLAAGAPPACLDLGALGLDRGGHILVQRALAAWGSARVVGTTPGLAAQLRAWARAGGHLFAEGPDGVVLTRGTASRWVGAVRAGTPERPCDEASAAWGLAPRGALVEAGLTGLDFPLAERPAVFAEIAGSLYRQAAAAQWDPETAIPWDAPFELPGELEDAIVQVMTYLVENETAALLVPARFVPTIHPHYREVLQLLAVQQADEARHIEVFTRRATLRRPVLGLSTVGGQTSLATLLHEPGFAEATLLLSVLGEGSFLALLAFLREVAPDPVTRAVVTLAARDEARHVAFGVAHLAEQAAADPGLLPRLALAVERRHDTLRHTAGLNGEVFDALVILAAGGTDAAALGEGFDRVQALERTMAVGRARRLETVGFDADTARRLAELHTRNFM